jgi:hypothetical protein
MLISSKMPETPIKWLKNRLKMYLVRVHEYNEGFYVDQFLKNVITDTIKDIIEPIILYGLVGYITLYGLMKIIIPLAGFIKLGTSIIDIFLAILLIGIILTVIRNLYKNVRFGGWKT